MRFKVLALLTTSTLLLCGCSDLFRNKVERKPVFIDQYDKNGRPIKIGVVSKNVKVPVLYETESGEQFEEMLDIGGFQVSPPAKVSAP